MWLVKYPKLGYLKIPHELGEPAVLQDEFSIVVDPGDSTALSRENAQKFADMLNQREGHKRWQVISWGQAYADFKASFC